MTCIKRRTILYIKNVAVNNHSFVADCILFRILHYCEERDGSKLAEKLTYSAFMHSVLELNN